VGLALFATGCGGSDRGDQTQNKVAGAGSGANAGSGSTGDGGTNGSGATSGATSDAGTSGSGQPSTPVGTCGNTEKAKGAEGRAQACVPTGGECSVKHGKYEPDGTPPEFEYGVLKKIGPDLGLVDSGGGALALTLDPSNSAVIYIGFEQENGGDGSKNGLYRSRDGGSTWKKVGTLPDDDIWDCRSTMLGWAVNVRVDPNNPDHMYVTRGVRGGVDLGFWVTWDGGESWIRAFVEDLTAMAVDPCDFCHVLLGSHTQTAVGVVESTDGGYSYVVHPPPEGFGTGGSYGIQFLFDPRSKRGDRNTWLLHGNGMWRTANAGDSWSKVSEITGIHGFTTLYYASNGDVYSGSYGYPARSTDNGLNWESSSNGLAMAQYYGLIGDGTNIYAMPDALPPPSGMMFTPEGDGMNWQPFGSSPPLDRHGMQHPAFDPNIGVVYFVNNDTVYGIKVTDGG